MRVDLPVEIMTRNKQIGRVTLAHADLKPFFLQGRMNDGSCEVWHRDGHWREDKTPHALDIVAIVQTDGALVALTDHFTRT